MADFSNSQKLAAVVSEWVRPAISQIASSKLMTIPFMQSLQCTIGGSGLVGNNYKLESDIQPFIQPIINSLITPIMAKHFANIPDSAIPTTARAIVNQMIQQGTYSILDGLVTFESDDILELDSLITKNLPIESEETYKVIH